MSADFRMAAVAMRDGRVLNGPGEGEVASHGHASDSDGSALSSTVLDPQKSCSAIVIKASNVTVDGRGAWLLPIRD